MRILTDPHGALVLLFPAGLVVDVYRVGGRLVARVGRTYLLVGVA